MSERTIVDGMMKLIAPIDRPAFLSIASTL
jgi:hypothetical protein